MLDSAAYQVSSDDVVETDEVTGTIMAGLNLISLRVIEHQADAGVRLSEADCLKSHHAGWPYADRKAAQAAKLQISSLSILTP